MVLPLQTVMAWFEIEGAGFTITSAVLLVPHHILYRFELLDKSSILFLQRQSTEYNCCYSFQQHFLL